MKKNSSLKEKLQYWFDSTIARGTPSMILWLCILSLLIVLFFSFILILVSSFLGEDVSGFDQTFWETLNLAIDPGAVADESTSSWILRITLLTISFFGIFVVSTLIGVIGGGVHDKIMDLRKGKSMVLKNSHTVILGWSRKIDVVIKELMWANEETPSFSVAVLAPRDKLDMESYLEQRLGAPMMKKIHCRSGDPSLISDLKIVSPETAKSILILCFIKSRSDSMILKRSMALQKLLHTSNASPPVVAEVHEKNNAQAIYSIGKFYLILSTEFITRVLVQVAREPGLSLVYEELFSFRGNEIYAYNSPTLTGMTLKEAALSLPNSSVIGLIDDTGEVLLNKDYDRVIGEKEKVLVIAEDDSLIKPPINNSPESEDKSVHELIPDKIADQPIQIAILGWHEAGEILLEELGSQIHPDSSIRVFYNPKYTDGKVDQAEGSPCSVKVLTEEADTSSISFLENLASSNLDEVIILGYREGLSIEEADGITMLSLVHLRNLFQQKNLDISIATELLDPANRDLLETNKAEDFIASEELLSRVMAQILEKPILLTTFEQLLTAKGAEIHLRSPKFYCCEGTQDSYKNLISKGINRKELVIGLIINNQKNNTKELCLNPLKSEIFTLQADDSIVVMAEN